MNNKLINSTLLVAGTSIGAGMLALPISNYHAGFITSTILMLWIWSVMLMSAFFLLEATLTQPKGTNLTSLTIKAFGQYGRWLISIFYLALLYSLNAAYINGMHDIILANITNLALGNTLCITLFLSFIILLKYRFRYINLINKNLVILLAITFIIIISQLSLDITPTLLIHHNNVNFTATLPIITASFGFQIIVPSLRDYCNDNIKILKKSIFIGSFIPLIVYIIWQACTLGVISIQDMADIAASKIAIVSLTSALIEHTQWSPLKSLIKYFTLFAITTSFIGVSISLFDFFKDAIKIKKVYTTPLLLTITFLPSLIFALYLPNVFIHALEYGGIIVTILLGLFPVLIAIKLRSKDCTSWQMPYSKFCVLWIIFAVVLILHGSKGVF